MVPHNVIIKNYKSYGNEETKIDLSGNSVKLIYGNVGAGKTTFVDGIIWCLYGESLVNVDEVINRRNKKNCKVEFNFSIGEEVFSVIRYRKHEEYGDDLIIFRNQKNISPSLKRESQELINSIVGMNHKAMISSVMFSSEIYISFLRVRESKRLEIFDSVLNMNVFKKWYDAVKAKKTPIEEEFDVAVNQIDKLEYGKATIIQSIEEYKNKAKTQLVKLKNDREREEKNIVKLKNEILQYQDIDIDEEINITKKFLEIEAHNNPLLNQIRDTEGELKKITKGLQEITYSYNSNKDKLEDVERIDISEEKQKLKIKEKNDLILQQINTLENKIVPIKDLRNLVIAKKSEILSIDKNKEEVEGDICYTCGQTIDKSIVSNIVRDLDKKKKNLLKDIEEIESKILLQEEFNSNVSKQINTLNNSIRKVDDVLSQEEIQSLSEKKRVITI